MPAAQHFKNKPSSAHQPSTPTSGSNKNKKPQQTNHSDREKRATKSNHSSFTVCTCSGACEHNAPVSTTRTQNDSKSTARRGGHSRRPQPSQGEHHPIILQGENAFDTATAAAPRKQQHQQQQQLSLGSTSANLDVESKAHRDAIYDALASTFYRDGTPEAVAAARERWAARHARSDSVRPPEREIDENEAASKWAHPIDARLLKVAGLVPEKVYSFNPYGADILGIDPYCDKAMSHDHLEDLQSHYDKYLADENEKQLPKFEDYDHHDTFADPPLTPDQQAAIVATSAIPKVQVGLPPPVTAAPSWPHVPSLGFGAPHLGFHDPGSYMKIRVGQDTICPIVTGTTQVSNTATASMANSMSTPPDHQQVPSAVMVRFGGSSATTVNGAAAVACPPNTGSKVSTPSQSMDASTSVMLTEETISPLESGIYETVSPMNASVNLPTPHGGAPTLNALSIHPPQHNATSHVLPPPVQQRTEPTTSGTPLSLFASPPPQQSDEQPRSPTTPSSNSEASFAMPSATESVMKFHPCRPVSAYSYFRQLAMAMVNRESCWGKLSMTQVGVMCDLKLAYPQLCDVAISKGKTTYSKLPADEEERDWDRPTTWEEFFQKSLGLKKFFYVDTILEKYETCFISSNEARLSFAENPMEAHAAHDLTVRNQEVLDAVVAFIWEFYSCLLDIEEKVQCPLMGPLRPDNLCPEYMRCPIGRRYFNNPSACSKSETKIMFRDLIGKLIDTETDRPRRDITPKHVEKFAKRFAADRRDKEAKANNRKDPSSMRQRDEKHSRNQPGNKLRQMSKPSEQQQASNGGRRRAAVADEDGDRAD